MGVGRKAVARVINALWVVCGSSFHRGAPGDVSCDCRLSVLGCLMFACFGYCSLVVCCIGFCQGFLLINWVLSFLINRLGKAFASVSKKGVTEKSQRAMVQLIDFNRKLGALF
jgi:hypothetical protein